MIDFDHFERWLLSLDYRPSTARAYKKTAERAYRYGPRRSSGPALHKLAQYGAEHGLDEAVAPVLAAQQRHDEQHKVRRGPARKRRRKRPVSSIPDEQWRPLCAAIFADDHPASDVLRVQVLTGVRIGDALRIERSNLKRALRTGSALVLETKGGDVRELVLGEDPEPWRALLARWDVEHPTMAHHVAPNGNGSPAADAAAGRAVARRLVALGEQVGIEERLHTHRLRRTVGVQALRLTEDVTAVQQLLGHRSPQTTLGYLDEARPQRVAELQSQLAGFRTPPERKDD